MRIAGVEQSTVARAMALWNIANVVFRRYTQELSLLVQSGLVEGELDEALVGVVGMPHRPSELIGCQGTGQSRSDGLDGHDKSPLRTADIISRTLFPAVNEAIDSILLSIEK